MRVTEMFSDHRMLMHRHTTLYLSGVMTVCKLRLYIHATRSVEIYTDKREKGGGGGIKGNGRR